MDRSASTGAWIGRLAGLPRASLAVLPGAGHPAFAETPEPFLDAVGAFLATLIP